MTNAGLILTVSAAVLAGIGVVLFRKSRHSAHTSQGAALTLFAHGAFATAFVLFFLTLFHVETVVPLTFHTHSIGDALAENFDCDLSLDCAVVSSLLVAALVLSASAILGQLSSRALLRRCRRSLDPVGFRTLPDDARPAGVGLWLVNDPRPDAFAVAILRLGGRRFVRVEDTVVVTSGIRDLLTEAELRAVLQHEYAHVRAHDHRYLPFVRTLSRILCLDPVLGVLARRLAARYELGADEDAAYATRDPRSLARALLKMYGDVQGPGIAASLRGGGRRALLLERIERLLALAEQMDAAA